MKAEKRVYLDYAAATPVDASVLSAMEPYFSEQFANPSSLYAEGRAARLALDDARKRVAHVLGARTGEVVFTAGGTEAINLAIRGVMKSYPQGEVLAAATEHQAVLACIEGLGLRAGGLVGVKKNGKVKLDELEQKISDKTVLVCAAAVNGELGTIQPLADVAAVIAKVRADRRKRGTSAPIYLFSDASAAAGHVSLQVSRTGVDILALNGGKIYGPKQSGALYVRHGVNLAPVIYGGGQERGLRSGTESLVQAVGFAAALALADKLRAGEERRQYELRKGLLKDLEQINGFSLNNPQHSLPGIVNFSVDGVNGEDLVYKLDAAGFAVATGAACAATSDEPSHALLAIGLSAKQANASLRISFGRTTTEHNLVDFAAALKGALGGRADTIGT